MGGEGKLSVTAGGRQKKIITQGILEYRLLDIHGGVEDEDVENAIWNYDEVANKDENDDHDDVSSDNNVVMAITILMTVTMISAR